MATLYSRAIDHLLSELMEVRAERNRVDTLIRTFAAQDAQTGLSNRQFFDNQLTTQLEETGAHGVVMMVQLPDFEALNETHDQQQVQELMSSLVNLLSTFVARYPSALLARYLNSDIAILLPHKTLKDADVMAAQLVNAVRTYRSLILLIANHCCILASWLTGVVSQSNKLWTMPGRRPKVRRCMVATVGMCSTLRYRSADVAVLNGVHYWNRLWRAEAQGFIKTRYYC